ncbi:hypothetical protein B0T14DRAFT_527639 [Immersiella caudata]|uniref:Uncharacterized protein n=1 Tax=Immersiella caudata TaxID=314043 RepID=A0AA39WET6_9PEZI|nr:hypothetical protein B0T14DRAFT_527639 [Immersiella caudata]
MHGEHVLVAVQSDSLYSSLGQSPSRPPSQWPAISLAFQLVAEMHKSRLPGPPRWARSPSSGSMPLERRAEGRPASAACGKWRHPPHRQGADVMPRSMFTKHNDDGSLRRTLKFHGDGYVKMMSGWVDRPLGARVRRLPLAHPSPTLVIRDRVLRIASLSTSILLRGLARSLKTREFHVKGHACLHCMAMALDSWMDNLGLSTCI